MIKQPIYQQPMYSGMSTIEDNLAPLVIETASEENEPMISTHVCLRTELLFLVPLSMMLLLALLWHNSCF